jgi:hypothetical protein
MIGASLAALGRNMGLCCPYHEAVKAFYHKGTSQRKEL